MTTLVTFFLNWPTILCFLPVDSESTDGQEIGKRLVSMIVGGLRQVIPVDLQITDTVKIAITGKRASALNSHSELLP